MPKNEIGCKIHLNTNNHPILKIILKNHQSVIPITRFRIQEPNFEILINLKMLIIFSN